MSTGLLVILTVIEIVALVAVLALFVILITRRLRAIVNALGQVSETIINRIQGEVFLVGAGAAILNRKLNAIAGALPAIAEAAESLASQQTQTSPGTQAPQNSETGWRRAVSSQDPVVGQR